MTFRTAPTTEKSPTSCASLPANAFSKMSGRILSTLPLAMIAEPTTLIASRGSRPIRCAFYVIPGLYGTVRDQAERLRGLAAKATSPAVQWDYRELASEWDMIADQIEM